jgi:tetratricopeptide (TPR) repeat protein
MSSTNRIQHLRDELRHHPGDVFYNYALGLEFAAVDPASHEAEAQFLKVLELEPSYIAAYYQLGRIFESRGDDQAALHWLKQGLSYARSKKDRKAINEFEEAIFLLED